VRKLQAIYEVLSEEFQARKLVAMGAILPRSNQAAAADEHENKAGQ
jgi:hypothetical protein